MSASANNDVLVRVKDVSKIFCRDLKKSLWYGLQDSAKDLLSWRRRETLKEDDQCSDTSLVSASESLNISGSSPRPLRAGEFMAVKNVSFELRRGECLALIGKNGAGKTTLLKMVNGLIKPDTGRIELGGRVGALIALGAGFNPILTGRENIYVNGSVLGLSRKEIDTLIEDIIDFSEIYEFIDSPVRTYSSGMQVRLGFAVATALKPDILILDEILAVGDSRFRQKCLNRVKDIRESCATIFVSHQEYDVRRIAKKAILLLDGQPVAIGALDDVFLKYNELSQISEIQIGKENEFCDQLEIKKSGFHKAEINFGDTLEFWMEVEATTPCAHCLLRLVVIDQSGQCVGEWQSSIRTIFYDFKLGLNSINVLITNLRIRSGTYQILMEITSTDGTIYAKIHKGPSFKVRTFGHSELQHAVQF